MDTPRPPNGAPPPVRVSLMPNGIGLPTQRPLRPPAQRPRPPLVTSGEPLQRLVSPMGQRPTRPAPPTPGLVGRPPGPSGIPVGPPAYARGQFPRLRPPLLCSGWLNLQYLWPRARTSVSSILGNLFWLQTTDVIKQDDAFVLGWFPILSYVSGTVMCFL